MKKQSCEAKIDLLDPKIAVLTRAVNGVESVRFILYSLRFDRQEWTSLFPKHDSKVVVEFYCCCVGFNRDRRRLAVRDTDFGWILAGWPLHYREHRPACPFAHPRRSGRRVPLTSISRSRSGRLSIEMRPSLDPRYMKVAEQHSDRFDADNDSLTVGRSSRELSGVLRFLSFGFTFFYRVFH